MTYFMKLFKRKWFSQLNDLASCFPKYCVRHSKVAFHMVTPTFNTFVSVHTYMYYLWTFFFHNQKRLSSIVCQSELFLKFSNSTCLSLSIKTFSHIYSCYVIHSGANSLMHLKFDSLMKILQHSLLVYSFLPVCISLIQDNGHVPEERSH